MPEGAIAITGSSRGIGAAIACELAARGLTVGCLSRGGGLPDGAEASEKFIPAQCDVTDEASIRDALAAVADKAGGLAGVVNNAGIHRETRSRDLTTEDYAEIMETNATSVMIVSREAYPHLEKNGGRIVNIGSFYDKLGVPRTLQGRHQCRERRSRIHRHRPEPRDRYGRKIPDMAQRPIAGPPTRHDGRNRPDRRIAVHRRRRLPDRRNDLCRWWPGYGPVKVFSHLDDTLRLNEEETLLLDSVRALARDKIAPRGT
jgi:hypothetical protein